MSPRRAPEMFLKNRADNNFCNPFNVIVEVVNVEWYKVRIFLALKVLKICLLSVRWERAVFSRFEKFNSQIAIVSNLTCSHTFKF